MKPERTAAIGLGQVSQEKQTTVPKVRLYVERARTKNWFVHVGHVTDRGRWRTEPHAHPAYGQVIFMCTGSGTMNLEGRKVPFDGPCALLLPPKCVHGLDYQDDVERWVVTIDIAYLTQINSKLHQFITLWASPRVIRFSDPTQATDELGRLIEGLRRETESDAVGHATGTEAWLTVLMLLLTREASRDEDHTDNVVRNDIRRVERFRGLIEEHFRKNLPLVDYASKMGMSPGQLRAMCYSAFELSPTKLIRERIIVEARRDLIFGDMTVEQIAFGLGFTDAAYFTRFFRKETGQTPSQFRLTARRQSALSAPAAMSA
ncbi:helix-turn-helix domain-containing protein [Paraburkholderia sp. HP33-1]|uniref:helix-turn-helix domain-containing protein n=1 Tax=Paraburkholderia sp. HP33-1 TaxID=2883243 RepID=UPI001F3A07CB|nr:helix-turn-helix domain-containing protein [Paraburkholderia sp. HP33-1]